jgi:hypothetical protein
MAHQVDVSLRRGAHFLDGVELGAREPSSSFSVVGEDVEVGVVVSFAETERHPKQRANAQEPAAQMMSQQMVSSLTIRESEIMIAAKQAKAAPAHKPKLISKSASNTLVNVVKGALSSIVQAGIIEDNPF